VRNVAIAAAAAPLVLLVVLWSAQRGRAYLDVEHGPAATASSCAPDVRA
jgi:hypothetical protein